jgi:hypothetical protein
VRCFLHGIIPNYRSLPSARFSSARAPSSSSHATAPPGRRPVAASPFPSACYVRAAPYCRASCSVPLQVAARPRRFRSPPPHRALLPRVLLPAASSRRPAAPLQVAARPRRFRSRAAISVARRRCRGATPPPPGSRLPPSD